MNIEITSKFEHAQLSQQPIINENYLYLLSEEVVPINMW